MRFLTAGESHGKGLMAILDGMPAGVSVDFARVNNELKRRCLGYGRGNRMKLEADAMEVWSGIRSGFTLGSPIGFTIPNLDHENWKNIIGPQAFETGKRTVTALRPGHADYAGCVKYGFKDARNVLERASARETAARVGVGAFCKELLLALGVEIFSHTVRIGNAEAPAKAYSAKELKASDKDPVRCMDAKASESMRAFIDLCRQKGDTAGGTAEIVISGLPAGIGSHVQYDRKLEYALMGQLGSIQSVKAVEMGAGAALSARFGSEAHDEMRYENRAVRTTNRAGGLEGGITNGEDVVVRVHFKPIPTLMSGLDTFDLITKQSVKACPERSDVCAVPAGGVVAEAVCAFAVANVLMSEIGGDTISEIKERFQKKAAAEASL